MEHFPKAAAVCAVRAAIRHARAAAQAPPAAARPEVHPRVVRQAALRGCTSDHRRAARSPRSPRRAHPHRAEDAATCTDPDGAAAPRETCRDGRSRGAPWRRRATCWQRRRARCATTNSAPGRRRGRSGRWGGRWRRPGGRPGRIYLRWAQTPSGRRSTWACATAAVAAVGRGTRAPQVAPPRHDWPRRLVLVNGLPLGPGGRAAPLARRRRLKRVHRQRLPPPP